MKKFDFDAPDCTCMYKHGHVARNMVGHTPPCPVYLRWLEMFCNDYEQDPKKVPLDYQI